MGMKIAPPTLGETRPGSELTERARRALLLRDSVEGLAFARDTLEDVEGERLDISQCRFTRCRIAPGRIKWLSFTDCVFENCDFSGALLRSASLWRVELRDCTAAGADFSESSLQSVLFQDAMLRYANFSRAKFHPARFESCCLDGAAFLRGQAQGAGPLRAAAWRRRSWAGMLLKGIDLRSTDIRGIRLTGGELKGRDRFARAGHGTRAAAGRGNPGIGEEGKAVPVGNGISGKRENARGKAPYSGASISSARPPARYCAGVSPVSALKDLMKCERFT